MQVIRVISWYWMVWMPRVISSFNWASVSFWIIRSSRDSPISLRSSMMVDRIFWRLTSTNGARWDKVKVWPPYWLLATWATIWVVMLQAV